MVMQNFTSASCAKPRSSIKLLNLIASLDPCVTDLGVLFNEKAATRIQ